MPRRLRRRRRSGGRPDPSADSRPALPPAPARSPPTRPGMENDEILPNQLYDSNQPTAPYDRVPTHCYHLSGGDNGIRSIGGLKDFQIGSHLSSVILKDFQIGRIGGFNLFQKYMSRRATDARTFANSPKFPGYKRIYGRNKTFDMEERKTFISSGCNHFWQEKLYGITRVGVYGVESICVVTRNKDLVQLEKDLARLWGSKYSMHEILPEALINEVEELACPPGEQRHVNRKRNQKPFGVVSVIAGTNEVHKVNRHEADELKAIEFLREEMNSASNFTFNITVKTAICALQLLWNKKFKPNKIRVFVWKKVVRKRDDDDDIYHLDTRGDDEVKELKIRDERSIKDILAVINNKPREFAESGM